MASELRVNTLKDASGNNSVGMSYVAGGSAKVWIDIPLGSASINDSFNVSSLDDDGTGYSNRAVNLCNVTATSYYTAMSTSIALDIENTSTHSVRFYMASSGNSDMRAIGDTNANQTGFTFIRLADT